MRAKNLRKRDKCTASQTLLDWMKGNASAPSQMLFVCERLATSPDMDFAWPTLLVSDVTPLTIFGMATESLRESGMDVRRMPKNDELTSVKDVRKAALNLRLALRRVWPGLESFRLHRQVQRRPL